MLTLFLFGVIVRGALFVMENKASATMSPEFVTTAVRCGLQWPVDVYDMVVNK